LPKAQAVGNLTITALYYLLRVGEYTYHGPIKHKRRTKKFRVSNVQEFWFNGNVLPLNAGLSALLNADAAALMLTNQKNGTKGAVIHKEATFDIHCPVQDLARPVSHTKQRK
jgi:hypothetical protein